MNVCGDRERLRALFSSCIQLVSQQRGVSLLIQQRGVLLFCKLLRASRVFYVQEKLEREQDECCSELVFFLSIF